MADQSTHDQDINALLSRWYEQDPAWPYPSYRWDESQQEWVPCSDDDSRTAV